MTHRETSDVRIAGEGSSEPQRSPLLAPELREFLLIVNEELDHPLRSENSATD